MEDVPNATIKAVASPIEKSRAGKTKYKQLKITIMKNKKQIEKKYVDELKDEYDRIGEIRANRITVGCLVAVLLALSLISFKLGLIIIK